MHIKKPLPAWHFQSGWFNYSELNCVTLLGVSEDCDLIDWERLLVMASKRQSYQEQEGDDRDRRVPGQETKRRYGDSKQEEISAVSDPMIAGWMNDIISVVREVVREEVPPMLQSLKSPCPCCGATLTQTAPPRDRVLQLHFMNKLPSAFFTFSRIVAEDGAPLQIALCDASDQNSVVKEGPLSKIKIEICVLNGDFGSNGCEDWTAEEFKANITHQREGKGSLLNGNTSITLEEGVGCFPKIVFTDNSCWTRNAMFRLGAKVVKPTSNYEADIREGKSEPFRVKDNRGESYKKHEHPSLNDEIWRLKKIAKDGKIHKKLSSYGINTVKDLMQLYKTNPPSLKEIIGSIPRKSWGIIIEHANSCAIDDGKRYIYYTEQQKGLLFNSVYEVVGVTSDGQVCRPLESLDLGEKHFVERAKQKAYKNLKDLIPVDETSTHCLVKPFAGLNEQFSVPAQVLQEADSSTVQQLLAETGPSFCQPSTSTSHIIEAVINEQLGIHQLPAWGEIQQNSSAGGEFIPGGYFDGNNWLLGGSHSQFANYHSPSNSIPWGQGNPVYPTYGDGAECSYQPCFPNSAVSVDISSKGKRKTFWYKIRTALKWVIPHVAKRRAKLYPYYC